MKRYYKVTGYVMIEDDSDWSESSDETFSIARKLRDENIARWWAAYTEVPAYTYENSYRILTPEGGV